MYELPAVGALEAGRAGPATLSEDLLATARRALRLTLLSCARESAGAGTAVRPVACEMLEEAPGAEL